MWFGIGHVAEVGRVVVGRDDCWWDVLERFGQAGDRKMVLFRTPVCTGVASSPCIRAEKSFFPRSTLDFRGST